MRLDPCLTGSDRFASALAGLGTTTYALLVHFDKAWVQDLTLAVGVVFLAGGIGGTCVFRELLRMAGGLVRGS